MPFFDVSVKMEDDYGRTTTRRFEVEEADIATALTSAASFITDLEAISKLAVIKYSVAQETPVVDSAISGANKDAGITLSVRKEDGDKAIIRVPDPVSGVVLGDGSVDLTDTNVTDFIANWLTGNFRVSDGETVSALLSGKLDE